VGPLHPSSIWPGTASQGAINAASLSEVGLSFPGTLQSLLPFPMFLLDLDASVRRENVDFKSRGHEHGRPQPTRCHCSRRTMCASFSEAQSSIQRTSQGRSARSQSQRYVSLFLFIHCLTQCSSSSTQGLVSTYVGSWGGRFRMCLRGRLNSSNPESLRSLTIRVPYISALFLLSTYFAFTLFLLVILPLRMLFI